MHCEQVHIILLIGETLRRPTKNPWFVQRLHGENMDVQDLHIVSGSLLQSSGTGSEDDKILKFLFKNGRFLKLKNC